MALICYQDGFVLVGSVAGQRYWSSMLNLEATITCGIWTPDDQQVYFGTTTGQLIVMDVHGAMVSQVQLSCEVGIATMAWSCEKFKMEEGDDTDPGVTNAAERKFVLAVSLQNGYIFLLKTFDDVSPVQIDTGLQGSLCMEWSNSREILAVAGIKRTKNLNVQSEYTNLLSFYNDRGTLLYCTHIPYTQSPTSALTWGHNDKRIFLATGTQIHIAWISRRIATLQLLCRLRIHNSISNESELTSLPLPPRLRNLIGNLFAQTIRCCVPESNTLREFVAKPPIGSVRLHCTMIRHDEDNNLSAGTCYTLYLEYLGGLVPLLKGKRTSKIRPEFVIFDPQVEDICTHLVCSPESKSSGSSSNSASGGGALSDSSDSDRDEGCTRSPRMQKRRKRRNRSQNKVTYQPLTAASNEGDADDLSYVDTLPEHVRLVEVTSNIWGTKFKIHGLVNSVPANLGQVTYKTSLLHLQPRQMTLVMTELRDDFPTGPDPNFNPNLFSDDEEEINLIERSRLHQVSIDHSPPIAPISSRIGRITKFKDHISNHFVSQETNKNLEVAPLLAKAESYDDEPLQMELTNISNYCEALRPQYVTSSAAQVNIRTSNNIQSTSFMSQYNKSISNNSSNQRHAISPLCCEGSVPALQSPKNAVAPSDIIFDRPPAQTLLSYSTTDYTTTINNVQQIKSNLLQDHNGMCRNGISLNLNNDQRKSVVVTKINCTEGFSENEINTVRPSFNVHKTGQSNTTNLDNTVETSDPQHANKGNTPEDISTVRKASETVHVSDSIIRSCSVGYLDLVDAQLVPIDVKNVLRNDAPRRLVLVRQRVKSSKETASEMTENKTEHSKSSKLVKCGKSKSLDSSDIFRSYTNKNVAILPDHVEEVTPEEKPVTKVENQSINSAATSTTEEPIILANNKRENSRLNFFSTKSPLMKRKKSDGNSHDKNSKCRTKLQQKVPNSKKSENNNSHDSSFINGISLHTHPLATLENLITKLRDDASKRTPPSSPRLPRSSPASPAPSKKGKRPQSASPIRRNLLASPLLGKKSRKNNKAQESSDDEITASGDDICNGKSYKDLETFQKAQLRQKLKRGKIEPNGINCNNASISQRREFVMHNKAPMWNESSQVYQLDFGGRVTQESAKNFQIEFRGKQVMQFGRIDGNAYTLDFQYPFSALQAFAVALANVTQRLK